MNIELIAAAKERVPSIPVLVNMVSKRVRQLQAGHRPLVKPKVGEEKTDVAMREIGEGKLIAEIDFSDAPSLGE
ncbi:MAG: DNA-directed RNA polymerase subunit omega [Verrucomicrobia bacterium]|nr:DNA-directed RNA polymerase subunit omega [Verrucomicrobiota bacterium]